MKDRREIEVNGYRGPERRNGNGSKLLLRWALTTLVLIILFMSGITANWMDHRIDRVELKTDNIGMIQECLKNLSEDIKEIKADLKNLRNRR